MFKTKIHSWEQENAQKEVRDEGKGILSAGNVYFYVVETLVSHRLHSKKR
jgi:hypothetical protein